MFSKKASLTSIKFTRCYAIMSRAKIRAGIAIPGKNTVEEIARDQKTNGKNKVEVDPSRKKRFTSELENKPEIFTKWRNEQMKKPAGIAERLVQVPKNVVQPMDPHMLKVAVIGGANAGKSTLVNKLVGEEVLGVSSKAHTTRERTLAVLSEKNYQIIFLDTPGIIPENNHAQVNRTIATSSWRSLDEADHALIIVDASWALQEKSRKVEEYLLSRLHDLYIPATLVFNKMDLIENDKSVLEPVKERYTEGYWGINKIAYTSALHENDFSNIKKILFDKAFPKDWLYPVEQKIEMPNLKRVEEIIRVEFFKKLHHYIPYMLKQENTGWVEEKGKLIIDQNVYVERESQLKIVVGANGNIIHNVCLSSREKIMQAFGKNVRLNIQVKTRKY